MRLHKVRKTEPTLESPAIDIPADKFAKILERCAEAVTDGGRRRVLEQLFYHLGRLVYLLDAIDDLPEDASKGKYNPLIYRYSITGGELTDEARESVLLSLGHSSRAISAAFELLGPGPWTGLTSNIVYDGIPAKVCKSALKPFARGAFAGIGIM